jgi:hypothetical protein
LDRCHHLIPIWLKIRLSWWLYTMCLKAGKHNVVASIWIIISGLWSVSYCFPL